MTELEHAVYFANRALDEPNCDPDDDLRTVSRQFLRLKEQNAKEVPEFKQRIITLESVFGHTPVSNQQNQCCNECGLDLRDPIHHRILWKGVNEG